MNESFSKVESVSFTRMVDGSAGEFAFLNPLYNKCRESLLDHMLKILLAMKFDKMGTRYRS